MSSFSSRVRGICAVGVTTLMISLTACTTPETPVPPPPAPESTVSAPQAPPSESHVASPASERVIAIDDIPTAGWQEREFDGSGSPVSTDADGSDACQLEPVGLDVSRIDDSTAVGAMFERGDEHFSHVIVKVPNAEEAVSQTAAALEECPETSTREDASVTLTKADYGQSDNAACRRFHMVAGTQSAMGNWCVLALRPDELSMVMSFGSTIVQGSDAGVTPEEFSQILAAVVTKDAG